MNKHHTLSGTDIENRAWEIAELFRAIELHAPMATGNQLSIETLAILGKKLVVELAEYAIGDRNDILGMATSTEMAPGQHTIEDVLRSYRQTVGAAVALIHAINAADLKRVPVAVAERGAIDEAVMEMMGHCDAARSDFLGGLDHE